MEPLSQNYVDVGIKTYGVGDLNRLLPFEYHGRIAKEITDIGKQFKDIHNGSISLKDQATLFQAYLASEKGLLELPGDVKSVLKYLFIDARGVGNVTDDACNYNDGDTGMKRVKKSDRRVQWIRHPKKFVRKGEGWEVKLGSESEVMNILIPKTGYVERTCDGAYRPDTGTPFSTVRNEKKARKSWTRGDVPLSDYEFAKKAVSYFSSRDEGAGIACVFRWRPHVDSVGGFNTNARFDPGGKDSELGRFASLESPSEASQMADKVVVTSEKYYGSLIAAVKKLSDQLGALNE